MFEPEIKTVPDETVAFIQMSGPYAKIPEGYGQLYGWVAQHGLAPQGMPEAVYLTAPGEVPEEQSRWELWAPVASDATEVPADETGCGVKHTGERTVACAMHTGPYEGIAETYGSLARWLIGQGYAMAGPPEEVYFSDPDQVPPEEYLTEIRFPVASR
jgi:AraC family transcriptional regulator